METWENARTQNNDCDISFVLLFSLASEEHDDNGTRRWNLDETDTRKDNNNVFGIEAAIRTYEKEFPGIDVGSYLL